MNLEHADQRCQACGRVCESYHSRQVQMFGIPRNRSNTRQNKLEHTVLPSNGSGGERSDDGSTTSTYSILQAGRPAIDRPPGFGALMERLVSAAARFALGMSEGFHPKPRMSFPSALALGMEGPDEVMEMELAEHCDGRQSSGAGWPHTPAGLGRFSGVESPAPAPEGRKPSAATNTGTRSRCRQPARRFA